MRNRGGVLYHTILTTDPLKEIGSYTLRCAKIRQQRELRPTVVQELYVERKIVYKNILQKYLPIVCFLYIGSCNATRCEAKLWQLVIEVAKLTSFH